MIDSFHYSGALEAFSWHYDTTDSIGRCDGVLTTTYYDEQMY
jgi:hypothetical protein